MIRDSIHRVAVSDVRDIAGTLQTSSNTLCKVTVKGADASTILAATTMTYSGTAGSWYYDVPAANFPSANAPWEVIVQIYDNTGATLRRTLRFIGEDEWWATS